jgi:hypothetical protein
MAELTEQEQIRRNSLPNKLYNDLNGLRKKNKLDIPPVQKEAVEAWINNAAN